MRYSNYNATDFAADEDFIRWVQQPTPEADAHWSAFLSECPAKYGAVQEARELVEHLTLESDEVPEWELEQMWQQLEQKRRQFTAHGTLDRQADEDVIPLNTWRPKSYMLAAAVSAILLVSGFWLVQQWQQQATTRYVTQARERMFLLLPDSSSVVLNANSTLTVPKHWSPNSNRVVQLEGQAYFSVTHQRNNKRFVVETADGLEVEVLGTEFSVLDQENRKQVVLEKGKVQLSIEQNGQERELTLTLTPGDLVEVDATHGITQVQVNTALYTAWKDTKLVFENSTLAQVAEMLEHSYGYKVAFEDPALKNERITAYLNKNSPEHILSTLAETLQVEISRQDKNITIL